MSTFLISFGSVLAGLITAVVGYLAVKARRVADKGISEVAAVTVSLSSLQAALSRSDIDREYVKLELQKTEAEVAVLKLEIARTREDWRVELQAVRVQCRDELSAASRHIRILAKVIQSLGGEVSDNDIEGTTAHE